MKLLSRVITIAFFAMAFLSVAATAFAFTFRSGNTVTVNDPQPIDGSLFVSGQNVRIESQVNGDVYCAGQNVEITGLVQGDIICAAQSLTINNTTQGNIRVAGQAISVSGTTLKNVTIAGQQVSTNGSIGGELMAAGRDAAIGGSIGSSVMAAGNSVTVSGSIGRDANIYASQTSLADKSSVGGSFTYYSDNKINQADGAKVAGRITQKQPPAPPAKRIMTPEGLFSGWASALLFKLIINLALALLLILFFGKAVIKLTDGVFSHTWTGTGFGLLLFLATPIVIVLLLISIIGLLAGAFLATLYAGALMLTRILAAVTVGRLILKRKDVTKNALYWPAIVGVVVSWIAFSIPAIGWIFSVIAYAWGFGNLWRLLISLRNSDLTLSS